QRRRRHPPPLPGAGAPVPAGAPPAEVRRGPGGLRAPQGPRHAPAPPPVRGRPGRQPGEPDRGGVMSESAAAGVPGDAAERPAQALTPPAIDGLLADFRRWLEDLAARPAPPPAAPAAEPIDLHTLPGQVLAVRHEVNLQTRAVRAQQELNADALKVLAGALDALRLKEDAASQAWQRDLDEEVRPLLKALVDLHDALALAAREAQRVQESLLPSLGQLAAGPARGRGTGGGRPRGAPPRPLLARLLGVRGVDEEHLAGWQRRTREALENAAARQEEPRRQAAERIEQLLGSLLAGYRMGLQRVERALAQQGLEAIPAAGRPFDPERMEVLEAVEG